MLKVSYSRMTRTPQNINLLNKAQVFIYLKEHNNRSFIYG